MEYTPLPNDVWYHILEYTGSLPRYSTISRLHHTISTDLFNTMIKKMDDKYIGWRERSEDSLVKYIIQTMALDNQWEMIQYMVMFHNSQSCVAYVLLLYHINDLYEDAILLFKKYKHILIYESKLMILSDHKLIIYYMFVIGYSDKIYYLNRYMYSAYSFNENDWRGFIHCDMQENIKHVLKYGDEYILPLNDDIPVKIRPNVRSKLKEMCNWDISVHRREYITLSIDIPMTRSMIDSIKRSYIEKDEYINHQAQPILIRELKDRWPDSIHVGLLDSNLTPIVLKYAIAQACDVSINPAWLPTWIETSKIISNNLSFMFSTMNWNID